MSNRIPRLAALAATTLLLSVGCAALSSSNSLSDSSGSVSSISDSVSDSSGSSSASSSGDGAEGSALERDVRTYTALYTESGGDVHGYLRGIGSLCERYAVSDWQRDAAVRKGIARGLAGSNLSAVGAGALVAAISGDDDELRESLWEEILTLRQGSPVATLN